MGERLCTDKSIALVDEYDAVVDLLYVSSPVFSCQSLAWGFTAHGYTVLRSKIFMSSGHTQ